MASRVKSRSYDASRRRRRRWHFADASFDEGSWSLNIAERHVPLEVKPAEILHELLLRAGEVVSKDELLDAIWPGVNVVESSLSVAISKLRRALGDEASQLIETVPRIGYRLAAPVTVETADAPLAPRFAFAAGEAVPGRPQWQLVEPLGSTGANDVWRARHEKTSETRVFKFADAPDRLHSLKREAAIARLLAASLGPEGPFVPLLEWNFGTLPYFLESRDGGASLLDWADERGGLSAISLERRMGVGRAIARALAQVHGAGILHKDLKPANILIEERRGADGVSAFRVRLADFGSGALLDETLLDRHLITGVPFHEGDGVPSGTAAYRAPEVSEGGMPTMKSDVYALGILLFQLVAGDFRLDLSPGWERHLADPLLAADIAEASDGNPDCRLPSAALMSERLERLEERRALAAEADAAERKMAALRGAEERRIARRPWVFAAGVAAAVGLIVSTGAAFIAMQQRDEARAQKSIAEASYSFLADDLMARADPAVADAADETVGAALRGASRSIDARFRQAPRMAGRLHQAMGRALAARADHEGARAAFEAAERSYAQAGKSANGDAASAAFQRVLMEAGNASEGNVARAQAAMQAAVARWGEPAKLEGVEGFWAAEAAGQLAMVEDHVERGLLDFQRGAELADSHQTLLSQRDRFQARHRLVRALMRMDRPADALKIANVLIGEESRVLGPDHADTLEARTFVAQALMQQYRNEEAIAALSDLLPRVERVYGRAHPRTFQIIGSRMESLKNMERYAEARADGEWLWKEATASLGPKSFYAIGSELDLARILCRAGDTEQGLGHAMDAWRNSVAGYGPAAALTGGVRHGVADCLLAAGRPKEALPWLRAIDRKAVGELVGNAQWGLHSELLEAEIAAATGRLAEGRRHFEAARPAFAELETDAYETRRIARVKSQLF